MDNVAGICLIRLSRAKALVKASLVILMVSIMSLIMVLSVFRDPSSQLTSQNVLRSSASPLCLKYKNWCVAWKILLIFVNEIISRLR